MTRGKIVLTPFPFTDLTASKVRPAIVVSDPARIGVDLILAFISSVYNSSTLLPTDELLKMTDADFALTGLKKNSVFKMDKLATVDSAIILGEMGEVSSALQVKLDAKLKCALSLK